MRVLGCVVAGIDRLMPKRKFPEFCEGLPKQAGIKIVCGELCWLQWWGEDDCILEKERQRGEGMDTQSVSALSVKIPRRPCLVTEVTDERLRRGRPSRQPI